MEASYDLATTLDCLSAAEPTAEQLDHGWQAVERSDLEGAETIEDWLVACSSLRPTASDPQSPKNLLLERLLEVLHKRVLSCEVEDEGWFAPLLIESLVSWYYHLGERHRGRPYLLTILAREGSSESIRLVADCLVEDPPSEVIGIDLVLGTLIQRRSRHTLDLFPRLLDGLSHPKLAPGILDLANFLAREGEADFHPATDQLPQLANLLKGISANLSRIESGSYDDSRTAELMQEQVLASISLGVSICDCFALTRYEPAMDCVLEAMDLGHRRLRCEAAWAVASLGDSRGTKELIQLSAEPVARLRVLAYAEELGILDQIPAEHQSLVARAEAELVVWLSEPAQMGLAPTSIELLDQREMAWPGFEDQQTCFLFRFSYNLGRGDYSNIGMSGPIALAATVDLLDMPPGEIYALFAGVHSRHEEIQEQPVEELASGYAPEIARLERRLKDEGLDNIEPRIFGLFFGDKTLVADAGKLGKPGVAVTDRVDVFWFPAQQKERAFTAADVYSLYKGRKLLRAFNPTDSQLDAHSTDATDDAT